MTDHPKVVIALVNWNNKDYLDHCLESVLESDLPFAYEIVVSDNGSTDGSLELLSQKFPQVNVLLNQENVGVARGNNLCIQNSTGEYIYVLNNDTIVNHDSILEMVDFLDENSSVGAVGGNLLNPDGTLQLTYCDYPTLLEELLIVSHIGKAMNPIFPSPKESWTTEHEVDWISSASIMVRRSAIEEIGLNDESFFIYSDETDWQYRLRKAGWQVFYLPRVNTIHFGGSSFRPGDRRYTLVYRGRMLFASKHYSIGYQLIQRLMFGLAAMARLLVWLILLPFSRTKTINRRQINSNIQTLKLALRLR